MTAATRRNATDWQALAVELVTIRNAARTERRLQGAVSAGTQLQLQDAIAKASAAIAIDDAANGAPRGAQGGAA